MKQQVYCYQLRFFSLKECMYLDQIQGQKLTMVLNSLPIRKFVLINDDSVNTSDIKILEKQKEKSFYNGISHYLIRELTPEEETTDKLFKKWKGQKPIKQICGKN